MYPYGMANCRGLSQARIFVHWTTAALLIAYATLDLVKCQVNSHGSWTIF